MEGLRIEAVHNWKGIHFKPEITIGNQVSIQQNVHITCADKLFIGDGTSILGNVCITDINHEYKDIRQSVGGQEISAVPVMIGEDCMIGFGAVIFQGVTIGRHVVVGANSVVTDSVPDFCVVAGAPARIIRKYDLKKGIWEKV